MENECSQLKALYNYINDGYLIINSGRCSGKTQTMFRVINYWIKHEAVNNSVCVYISPFEHNLEEFKRRLAKYLINNNLYVDNFRCAHDFKILKNDGTICYISFVQNVRTYFNSTHSMFNETIDHKNITLIVGDECYIDPHWCKHTACAYTQIGKITKLEYSNEMKEQINNLKKSVSKEFFEQEFGRYL